MGAMVTKCATMAETEVLIADRVSAAVEAVVSTGAEFLVEVVAIVLYGGRVEAGVWEGQDLVGGCDSGLEM